MTRSIAGAAFALGMSVAIPRTVDGQALALTLPAQVPYASLTANQQAMVERGGNVQLLERLPTSPWPRSVVFEFIDATPEECAAVIFD